MTVRRHCDNAEAHHYPPPDLIRLYIRARDQFGARTWQQIGWVCGHPKVGCHLVTFDPEFVDGSPRPF